VKGRLASLCNQTLACDRQRPYGQAQRRESFMPNIGSQGVSIKRNSTKWFANSGFHFSARYFSVYISAAETFRLRP
jgi:hypothetical protein